jgi:hypothetical protein
VADTDDTRSNDARRRTEDDGPKQTVRRLGSEQESGPFFPSGMSAPEAALAGATAGMSDDQVRQVEQDFMDSGAPTDDGVNPDMKGIDRPGAEGDTDDTSDRPAQSANKEEWENYRRDQGHDVEGLTKQELIDLD